MGNSGLKVSRIILGCMSYGTPEWRPWVLPEDEGVEHIKIAYDNGINTFDTANARTYILLSHENYTYALSVCTGVFGWSL